MGGLPWWENCWTYSPLVSTINRPTNCIKMKKCPTSGSYDFHLFWYGTCIVLWQTDTFVTCSFSFTFSCVFWLDNCSYFNWTLAESTTTCTSDQHWTHHALMETVSPSQSMPDRQQATPSLTTWLLVFLPSEHILNSSIVFQQLESLSLLGNLSSLPSITSKIVCNNTSAFILKSISYLEIKALAFNSCGRLGDTEIPCTIPTLYYNIDMVWVPEVLPAISALLVQNFHLASCQFKHNFLPLLLNHSESYIGNSDFVANMGSLGGAIFARASNITLQEQNSFTDNFAVIGGGIFASPYTKFKETVSRVYCTTFCI